MIIEEGKAKIFAPYVNPKGPGKIEGIFYNREMVINRDSTIFLISNIAIRNALDGLAATGIRGIRMIMECGVETTLNDNNPRAVEIIKRNVELNGVEARIMNRDVNALMAEEKFHYVDIDPFGSPVPFIDMALRSGKILGITATDTATLGGRNKRIERRYLASISSPPEYVHEIGVRVLLGYIGRMAIRFDLGIEPIFSMWYGHFYRVYVRILRGVGRAKRTMENIGTSRFGGPLWLGDLHNFSFLKNAKVPEWIPNRGRMEKYLEIWKNEKFFLFYHLPSISSQLKISTPPLSKVIQGLKDIGYNAYRTQFSPQGIRTDAPEDVIKDIILSHSTKGNK